MMVRGPLEALCEGFCTLTGAEPPNSLLPADDGLVAFNVIWRDVIVDLTFSPKDCPTHAFMHFELGPIQTMGNRKEEVLRALLQGNFLSFRAAQPVFSCHPLSDNIMLQYPLALADTSAQRLQQIIEEGVALALDWRRTGLIPASPTGELRPGEPVLPGSFA